MRPEPLTLKGRLTSSQEVPKERRTKGNTATEPGNQLWESDRQQNFAFDSNKARSSTTDAPFLEEGVQSQCGEAPHLSPHSPPLPRVPLPASLCPRCSPLLPASPPCRLLPKTTQDKSCCETSGLLVTPGCVGSGRPLPLLYLTPHQDYISASQSGVSGGPYSSFTQYRDERVF